MSNLSCGTHVAEPSANKDCRKLLNQFCRFLPKLKLPISADAKLPLTLRHISSLWPIWRRNWQIQNSLEIRSSCFGREYRTIRFLHRRLFVKHLLN